MADLPDDTTRELLTARLAALDEEDRLSQGARATVELDQQAVGRLSRMDALQMQAMARAQATRRAGERRRLMAALKRLDEGEYGYCTDCGEELAPARLAQDPAVAKCISCAHG